MKAAQWWSQKAIDEVNFSIINAAICSLKAKLIIHWSTDEHVKRKFREDVDEGKDN